VSTQFVSQTEAAVVETFFIRVLTEQLFLNYLFNLDGNGTMATVAGWGMTSEEEYEHESQDILRSVEIPIITNDECQIGYPGAISDKMICAGYASGGKDSCQGDSGGPLFTESKHGQIQLGIVSWGEGCARPDFYGVYTKLSAYVAWMAEEMKKYTQ